MAAEIAPAPGASDDNITGVVVACDDLADTLSGVDGGTEHDLFFL